MHPGHRYHDCRDDDCQNQYNNIAGVNYFVRSNI